MITWIAVSIGLIGTILNTHKNPLCFRLWLFSNGYLAVHNFLVGEYAQGSLLSVYFCLAVYGIIKWGKGDKHSNVKEGYNPPPGSQCKPEPPPAPPRKQFRNDR